MMQQGFRKPSGVAPGQQGASGSRHTLHVGSRASDLFLPHHLALPVHPQRSGQGRPFLQPLPLCLTPHASHPVPRATARIGPGSPLQLAPGSVLEAAENRSRGLAPLGNANTIIFPSRALGREVNKDTPSWVRAASRMLTT